MKYSFFKTISAPEKPVENKEVVDWKVIEKQIGTKLPRDYKKFIEIYGTGWISNFLWIFNPFSINKYLNMINRFNYYKYLTSINSVFYECLFPLYSL